MTASQVALTDMVMPPLSNATVSLAILVAEDSIITQDLLKLLLTQRGHSVDTVEDGAKALNALQDRQYDIALMDFHLPTMDGLRVVSAYKDLAGSAAPSTHFSGITADVAGFMARPDSWQTFDLVIAKPIDIANLCSAVENFEHYMAWRSHSSTHPGAVHPTPVVLADDGASGSQESPEVVLRADGQPRLEKRVKIDRGTTQLQLTNGEVYPCRVIDLSLGGAALEIDARPAIGEQVRVGRTEGKVIRHTADGIAVVFGTASR
ncbi:MAG TPA: response regulator [Methyloceanibacter sp.]|nr:response regulator [Methyloceanibacter sp.]